MRQVMRSGNRLVARSAPSIVPIRQDGEQVGEAGFDRAPGGVDHRVGSRIERSAGGEDAFEIGHGFLVVGHRAEVALRDNAAHMLFRRRLDPYRKTAGQQFVIGLGLGDDAAARRQYKSRVAAEHCVQGAAFGPAVGGLAGEGEDLAKREPARATEIYRQFAALAPQDPRGNYLVGVGLLAQGKRAEARKEFEAALTLAPGFVDPLSRLIALSFAEKQPDAALERARQQAALLPKSAMHRFLRKLRRRVLPDRQAAGKGTESILRLPREQHQRRNHEGDEHARRQPIQP